MKTFCYVGATLAIFVAVTNAQDKCDSIQVDACGKQLYGLTVNPNSIPTTEDDFVKFCSDLRSGEGCLQSRVKDCPTMFSSVVSGDYLKKTPEYNDNVCQEGGKQIGKGLINHGQCLREVLKDSTCGADFINGVEAATFENKPEQLLAACCVFVKFEACAYSLVKASCGQEAEDVYKANVQQQAGFLAHLCTSRLTDPAKQCPALALTPLPSSHRKLTSPLPGYVDAIKSTLGP